MYRLLTWFVVAALFASATAGAQTRQRGARRAANPTTWQTPQCTVVSGLPSIRFATGEFVAPNRDTIDNEAAWDLVVTNIPNLLYAAFRDAVYESRDAGCTWLLRATIPEFSGSHFLLAGTAGREVYAYSRTALARITPASTDVLPFPVEIHTLMADPHDWTHLLAIGQHGEVHTSKDAGESWTRLGDVTRYLVYSVAADPADFEHLVVATLGEGIRLSYDGGRTWRYTDLQGVNVFEMEFSPVDSRIVWAQGGYELYRSTDGGESFSLVLTSSAQGSFSRAKLAPHRHESNVVAISAHQGIVFFDASAGSSALLPRLYARALEWSPAGTLYFSAPDHIYANN